MDFTTDLPIDVVVSNILNRLDTKTWAYLNLVSKSWRAVAQLAPPHPPFPWIWCLPKYAEDKSPFFRLHGSTTEAPSFTPPPPEMGYPLSTVSSHGQYVMLHTFKQSSHTCDDLAFIFYLLLYNPFTRHAFPLPSTIRSHDDGAVILNDKFITRIAAFSSPIPTTSRPKKVYVKFVVAAFADYFNRLCVFRMGKNRYHWLAVTIPNVSKINDLIIYKDQVYFTTFAGDIMKLDDQYRLQLVFDSAYSNKISRHFLDLNHDSPQSMDIYLIELHGNLFIVTQHIWGALIDDNKAWEETGMEYEIKRLDEENRKLVEIDDLGDSMMFLGKGCSRSCSNSLWACGFLSKNCIYSLLNDVSWKFSGNYYRVGKFCLDKVNMKTKTEKSSNNFVVHHPPAFGEEFYPSPKWITPYPEREKIICHSSTPISSSIS